MSAQGAIETPRRRGFDLGTGFEALREPGAAARFAATLVIALLAIVVVSLANAWLAAWLLGFVDRTLTPDLARAVVPVLRQRFALDGPFIIVAVIAAPVIEAALLALGADYAASRAWSRARIVAVAGAAFGVLHAGNGLLAVLPAAGVFMVLAVAYLHWRRHSFELGVLAAVLPHAAFNGLIVGLKATFA